MAANQGNQRGNRNRNRGGGGLKCWLCPTNGRDGKGNNPQPNALPKDRAACFACSPERKLTALDSIGQNRLSVVISTTENGVPAAMKFLYGKQGSTKAMQPEETDASGSKTIQVEYSKEPTVLKVILEGGTEEGHKAEIPVPVSPKAKKQPDTTQEPPEYSISAAPSHGSESLRVLIQTFRNGHHYPCKFIVEIDGKQFVVDETAKGTKKSEPIGTKIIQVENGGPRSSFKRQGKAWVVGSKAVSAEFTIDPKQSTTAFQQYELPESETPKHSVTLHLSDAGTHVAATIQTYIGDRQEGNWFAYEIEGEPMKFEHTGDGVSDINHSTGEPIYVGDGIDEPKSFKGLRVLNIPFDLKDREITVHLLGVNANIERQTIPGVCVPYKPPRVDYSLGGLGNLKRAVLAVFKVKSESPRLYSPWMLLVAFTEVHSHVRRGIKLVALLVGAWLVWDLSSQILSQGFGYRNVPQLYLNYWALFVWLIYTIYAMCIVSPVLRCIVMLKIGDWNLRSLLFFSRDNTSAFALWALFGIFSLSAMFYGLPTAGDDLPALGQRADNVAVTVWESKAVQGTIQAGRFVLFGESIPAVDRAFGYATVDLPVKPWSEVRPYSLETLDPRYSKGIRPFLIALTLFGVAIINSMISFRDEFSEFYRRLTARFRKTSGQASSEGSESSKTSAKPEVETPQTAQQEPTEQSSGSNWFSSFMDKMGPFASDLFAAFTVSRLSSRR